MWRLYHCMNCESANNVSRQSEIRIVTWLQVLMSTDLGLSTRKCRIFPVAQNTPIQHKAHTACFSLGTGNKGPWFEIEKKTSYHPYEGRAVYTAIPSTFRTERDLHSLIANKRGVSYVNMWVH
jgi:hypothetical protein